MSNTDAAAFNRCIHFMVRMIEKYGSEAVPAEAGKVDAQKD